MFPSSQIILSPENPGRFTQWFDWYNQERFHQNLDNQTPNEVYWQYTTIHQAA
ncbi:MAG: integrase core domain-containing protein [Nitrosomonas sp.]|nr:integrase core domain-containing protein [Nitrosomonas sp.]